MQKQRERERNKDIFSFGRRKKILSFLQNSSRITKIDWIKLQSRICSYPSPLIFKIASAYQKFANIKNTIDLVAHHHLLTFIFLFLSQIFLQKNPH